MRPTEAAHVRLPQRSERPDRPERPEDVFPAEVQALPAGFRISALRWVAYDDPRNPVVAVEVADIDRAAKIGKREHWYAHTVAVTGRAKMRTGDVRWIRELVGFELAAAATIVAMIRSTCDGSKLRCVMLGAE